MDDWSLQRTAEQEIALDRCERTPAPSREHVLSLIRSGAADAMSVQMPDPEFVERNEANARVSFYAVRFRDRSVGERVRALSMVTFGLSPQTALHIALSDGAEALLDKPPSHTEDDVAVFIVRPMAGDLLGAVRQESWTLDRETARWLRDRLDTVLASQEPADERVRRLSLKVIAALGRVHGDGMTPHALALLKDLASFSGVAKDPP